ncbi:MAG: hypothetical protein MZU91_03285 [Desulfosudis oleivorans]|nr:hypothetical protein [Desulfosudis oleivorans]
MILASILSAVIPPRCSHCSSWVLAGRPPEDPPACRMPLSGCFSSSAIWSLEPLYLRMLGGVPRPSSLRSWFLSSVIRCPLWEVVPGLRCLGLGELALDGEPPVHGLGRGRSARDSRRVWRLVMVEMLLWS